MSRTPQEPTHLEHISAHPQPQPSCTCLGRPATDHRHNQNGDYCKNQRYSDSKSDIQSGRVLVGVSNVGSWFLDELEEDVLIS